MRVAILTTEYPPHWGGLGANAYYTARELGRRGHDVHVVTRSGRRGAAAAPDLPNVTPHGVGFLPVPVHYAVSFARRAVPAALALRPDVVHVHSPSALPTRREWDALDASGALTAVTFHGTWRGERGALGLDSPLGLTPNDVGILALSRAHERLEAEALRRARLPITVSGFSRRELTEYDAAAAARVVVVPNGVDTDEFTPGRPEGSGRVLAVGRLSGRKNLLTLVRAAAHLGDRIGALVLVGRDGGLRRAVEREARRRGVPLEVRPGAAHWELLNEYRRADAFALPSRYEAQGIAFLEAMACGIPVVAGAAGGVPEVVTDGVTGRLVPPDDERAVADALGAYLADADLARAHGEAGRRRAVGFDWRVVTEDLLARYKEAA